MMSNVFGAVEWSRIQGGVGVGGTFRDDRMLSRQNLVDQLSQNFHTSFSNCHFHKIFKKFSDSKFLVQY